MKTLALVCLFLASLHARADLVIEEKFQVTGHGEDSGIFTIKIKGDKARLDMGTDPAAMANTNRLHLSVIINTSTGGRIMLVHDDKTFMQLPGAAVQSMVAQLKKQEEQSHATDPAWPPKITDTGKKEKVGDYNAEIYTAETPKIKCTFWISREAPDYASLQTQLDKLQAPDLMMLSYRNIPDASKIDGALLKMKIENNGVTFTSEITSVKQAPVADDEFLIPAGYKQGPGGMAPD